MYWYKKLTKKEKAHLRENGIRNKQDLLDAINHQKNKDTRCFECSHIAYKIGLRTS